MTAMSWRECADAGMTATEAAQHRGQSQGAARYHAKRGGFKFRPGYDVQRQQLRAMFADPVTGPALRKNAAEASRKWWADPANNPLVLLTPEQRAEYDRWKNNYGFTRDAALRAVGRSDLVGK